MRLPGWLPRFSWCAAFALAMLCSCTAQDSSAPSTSLNIGGAKLDVTLPGEQMNASRDDLLRWIRMAADAVTQYYGRFPVPHVTIHVRSYDGNGVRHGMTFPRDGGLIEIHVGRHATNAGLQKDWMLTHEMIHLAFPSMADSHHWIEEGISTYVEPVARARAGQLSAEKVWHDFVRDMPQGEPEQGDQGLDRTHTWGRTYWGGALFCLVADVRIREQTGNRKGLQDALRAIMNAGGVITEDWDIERALAIGDKATGTTVLMSLYGEMKDKPVTVDLGTLWHNLGVDMQDGQVRFDPSAPMSAARAAITVEHVAAARVGFNGDRQPARIRRDLRLTS